MICSSVNLLTKPLSILTLSLALALGLAGCDSGGGSAPVPTPTPTPDPVIETQSITGGGVKGPLANAVVTVYAFDGSKRGNGFKGSVVATAATDEKAAITGLALPFPVTPPYIMEYSSTPGATTDITTGQFPVITTLRTVISQSLLDGGQQIYATPLTTMAVDIAVSNTVGNGNGTSGIQADEFETALVDAASQVVSTLGFGMDSSVDIFDTPPLIDNTTTTTADQAAVAAYRTAVEAVTAIAYEINQQSVGASTDTVLADLAASLADNGVINDSAGTTLNTNTLQVLEQDPATLTIPNTTQTVAEVQAILAAETSTTGSTTTTTELTDGTITTESAPAETNPDIDGDGVLNVDDAFPENAAETVDTDGDGIGDNADPDDDNNGILDVDEGVTPAPTATDTDGDGILDGAPDNCINDFNPSQTNTDADAEGDACDTDDDNDTVLDTADAFPLDAGESVDTDSDGLGDTTADSDDDNDGVADGADTGTSPIDGTTACSLLTDCDGDGVLDGADFDPIDPLVTFNFAPIANDDTATANEDDALFTINVIANDTDNDGNPNDTITLTDIGTTTLGFAVMNANSIDYTPAADLSGVDTFTYTVSDGTVTSVATVVVTITAVNDAPVVGAAGPFSLAENAANATVVGTVTATDVDSAITAYSISAGNTGVAFAIDASGQITVADTAVIDYESATSFALSITATDGVNTSAVEVVTVNVTDVNDTAPVVGAAAPFTIAEDIVDAAVVGSVTATDVDTVGSVIGYTITTGNTGNAFTISAAGQITVADTAAVDYEVATSFSLSITATDGTNTSAAQVITVNVTDVNDTAPVVGAAGPFSVAEDVVNASVVGTVSATDLDAVGAVTNYAITAGNIGTAFAIDASGQITVADTAVIDFESATSFALSITATDGTNTSAVQVVTVNITDANDTAPVVGAAGSFSIAEDAANATVVGSVTATDIDTVGSVTGYTITAGNTGNAFAISASGQVTIADTAVINFETITSYSLSITATDGVNTSVAEVVTVNISDANDTAPVVGAAGSFSVAEDAVNATVVGSVTATDVDTVGSVTDYTIISGNTGSAFAISAGGQITVADTSVINFEAITSYSLSITATDGINTSAAEVVTVNITDVNDTAPIVAAAGPFGIAEDATNATVVGTVIASDADGVGAVTGYTITNGNTGVAFAISAAGQITVADTTAIDYESSTSFNLSITATDGVNTSAVEIVTVNITDANDTAPVVAAGQSFNVIDTATNGIVVGSVSASDADTVGGITGFTITGTAFAIAANGQITVINAASLGADGTIHNLTVDATDGINASASENVTITVVTNALPIIAQTGPLEVTMDEDGSPVPFVVSTISATDTTIPADTLTWSTPGATNGVATVSGTGASPTITYVPSGDFNGGDSFIVNVNDGTSTVGITVNVTVDPVNDAPVAVDDSVDTTAEDTPFTTANVLLNDNDIDVGDILIVSGFDAISSANGTVGNIGDGTFTYTPAANYYGPDSFTYTVWDGSLTSVATVYIDVTSVNDAPVAGDDSESTVVNVAFTTADVLINDSDVEGDPLSVVAGNPTAANGTVVNNNDGTFIYTPNTDYIGSDSFTYTVSDSLLTATGTVNITVTPPGTPISTVTLLDGAGVDGGVGGLDDGYTQPDGSISFEYWSDIYNSLTNQIDFVDKKYNYATSQYDLISGIQEDLVLTASGWVRFNTIDALNDGGGNLDITLRDASNAAIATFNITAAYVDIGGQPMVSYVDAGWNDGLIDPAVNFGANAKEIVDMRWNVTGADQYWLGEYFDCDEWNPGSLATLNGNCNAVDLDGIWATLLSQVVAGSAWIDPNNGSMPPTGIFIANNFVNNTSLYVELVSDNSTNYYVVDHNIGDTAEPVAGTAWRTATVMTQTLYEFDVPSQFDTQFPEDIHIEEGLTYFVTEQNGFVRQGQKHDLGGYEAEAGMLNGVALNEILANHDPVKALGYNYTDVTLGTGYDLYYDAAVPTWCIDSYNFYGNGTYDGYDYVVCSGTASGWSDTYSINPTTGVMMIVDGVDTFYRKVVGFNPTYGAKETCVSLSESGPFDCVEGDEFFGYEFYDSIAAENAMNALNTPAPAISFPDAAVLAGTTQYNVAYCSDGDAGCTIGDWDLVTMAFNADGSTLDVTYAGSTYPGTYSVANGVLVATFDGGTDYIAIASVDGATGADRTCWVSSVIEAVACTYGDEFFFDNLTDAQNFQTNMTFTAGAAVDAATLLAGGIYEFWDDSWDGTQEVPGYWMISVNGATIVDSDYIWSVALNKFLPESYNTEDLMLTSTGWQLGTDDVADVSFSANQATLNIRAPDNEIVQTWVMNLEQMDISGREIGLYAPHTMLDNVNATFSSGAQSIKETGGASMNYTQLHVWDGCAEYVTWGNNCNVIWRRQMTGSDVAVPLNPARDLTFIDTVGATIELGWHSNSGPNGTSLLGVFSGSTISYWTVNWDAGTTAVDTGITSTFTYSTEVKAVSAGVTVIEYAIPTNIPGYYDFNLSYDTYDNEIGVLAVEGSYLRHGDKEIAAPSTYYELNSIAANDVFNNQPVAPAITGSWVYSEWGAATVYPESGYIPDVMTFFGDNNYMHSGPCEDPSLAALPTDAVFSIVGHQSGTATGALGELGAYSWDSSNNSFTGSVGFDFNLWCGLTDTFATGIATATIVGNTMTVDSPNGAFTLNRITTGTQAIVGTWVIDPANPSRFTFFENGYFTQTQSCLDHVGDITGPEPIAHGMEYGTYSWNSGTGALTGDVLVDTNGWCGTHSTNQASTALGAGSVGGIVINVDGDVMTFQVGTEEPATLYRVE